jgi:ferrous iron transport protein B
VLPDKDFSEIRIAPTEESLAHSFAGRFGKLIEPVLQPLGYDWKIGVALTAGFAAKEIVVSTLATVYTFTDDPDESGAMHSLQNALRNNSSLTPVTAYGLMLFVLIYVPCMASLYVLKREAGGWRWALLMVTYTTALAWIVTFTFERIAMHLHLFM